ncbi:YihD family protein [Sansalvadorimonas sp. 2012CJ34-2]|uniref:YihD family protein n=1 Tax=Parendozoicomonas callyspongiae TaxID=2942213 RepID=A0ABT0PDR6_9GAMM|nr:DUF1040 family protein [Sansalvadorimonas sp. 2012CJ34-2]MCL6269453.1 YihD family protein [Sansalvadorimonas sp. 2012CJ34-2]
MSERRKQLLNMLLEAWDKEPEQDLMRVVEHLAAGAGHLGSISNFKDDALFMQLEHQKKCSGARLGGVHSEYIPDFRAALLSARGCQA